MLTLVPTKEALVITIRNGNIAQNRDVGCYYRLNRMAWKTGNRNVYGVSLLRSFSAAFVVSGSGCSVVGLTFRHNRGPFSAIQAVVYKEGSVYIYDSFTMVMTFSERLLKVCEMGCPALIPRPFMSCSRVPVMARISMALPIRFSLPPFITTLKMSM